MAIPVGCAPTPRFFAVRNVQGEPEFWKRIEILAAVLSAVTKSTKVSPFRSPMVTF